MSSLAERSPTAVALIQHISVVNRIIQERVFAIATEPSQSKRKKLARDLRDQYKSHTTTLHSLVQNWAATGLDEAFEAGRRHFHRSQ